MSRSKWKGPYLTNSLLKSSLDTCTISRNSIIPASCLGKFINIYTGNEYKKVFISKEKIGLKFGSFAYSRKGRVRAKQTHKKK